MGPEFFWTLPAREALEGGPAAWIDIAQAVEYAGFDALVAPSGPSSPDAAMVVALLARHTRTLRFMAALRPGLVQVGAAAQAMATLQRVSDHRLALSVAMGQGGLHRSYGDLLDHDDRFARATEYLHVLQQLWQSPGRVSFRGRYVQVENGGLLRALKAAPALYIGGTSPAAERLAALFAQVHYQWADDAQVVAAATARVRAAAAGRALRFGCRVHVVARHTEADAWQASAPMGAGRAGGGVVRVSPSLWTGATLAPAADGLPSATGSLLAGSYGQVLQGLEHLYEAGIDVFLLSADDGVEGAMRFGEEVLARFRRRPRKDAAQRQSALEVS